MSLGSSALTNSIASLFKTILLQKTSLNKLDLCATASLCIVGRLPGGVVRVRPGQTPWYFEISDNIVKSSGLGLSSLKRTICFHALNNSGS